MKKIYLLVLLCLSVIACSKEKETVVEKEKTKHFVQYYVENKFFSNGDSLKYYYLNQEGKYTQEILPAKRTWSYSMEAFSGDTVYCIAFRSNFRFSATSLFLFIDHKEVTVKTSIAGDANAPSVYAILP